jgi:signal transduction histidine kinase
MPVAAHWQQHGTQLTFEPGEYIFRLDEPADEVFLLISGRVALLKDTRTEHANLLGYRGTGELLGEASLIAPDASRQAWALVVEQTEALSLLRDVFWRLIDEDASFRREMVAALIDHLVAADEGHLQAVAHERDLFERLASLSNEHDRMGQLMQLRHDTMHFIIHDLRNPLNLVKSAVSMLESQGLAGADQETRTIIMMAQRGVQRMLALVETLLDVDRLEEGAPALDLETLDVGSVLEEVYLRIQPLAAASEIVMNLDIQPASLPLVLGDRQRIDRVITNLVDNALKFTVPETRIDLSAWQDHAFLYVAVDDQGPGVPADQRSRIFERFAQTDTPSQGRRGFGLGLAYCRSAIAAHGGKIWAEDAPEGIGMRFIFSLPIPPDA